MTDQLEREAARGQQANDLLGNELYKEAWEKVESEIIQKWKDCAVKDITGQHELKMMLRVLSEVRRYVQIVAETGKMAQIQLDNESKINKFASKAGDAVLKLWK